MKEITLNIPDMNCNKCVSSITNALNKLDGFKKIDADLKKKKVAITFDESVLNEDDIINCIDNIGFEASK